MQKDRYFVLVLMFAKKTCLFFFFFWKNLSNFEALN